MAWPLIALSVLKAKADADQAQRDRGVAAVQQSVSPWSGVAPQAVSNANTFGTLTQGVGAALAQDQADAAAEAQKSQQSSLNEYLKNQQDLQKQTLDLKRQQAGFAPRMSQETLFSAQNALDSFRNPQAGYGAKKPPAWTLR